MAEINRAALNTDYLSGARAADRLRAAFLLRRVARRLERQPRQSLSQALTREWQSESSIPIIAVACALDALQQVTQRDRATASALFGTPDESSGWVAAQSVVRVAQVELRSAATAQAQGNGADVAAYSVRMPALAGAEETMPSGVHPGAAKTAEILVVDDDQDIRRVLRLFLEDEGYTVTTAQHGRDALACIEQRRPDLVLLDLQMPVMSGWELREELARREIAIPVVFMTAGDRARAEAERHHVAGYLAKPFDLEDVLSTVSDARQSATNAA